MSRTITLTLNGGTTATTLADTATPEETRAAIQAALDQASANPAGGTVSLSAGTYVVTPGIDAGEGAIRVGSHTIFEGAGMGLTTIQLAADPGHDVTGIVRTGSGKTNPDGSIISTHDIVIRNLSIDGNKDNTGSSQVDGFFCGPKPFTSTAVDTNITLENVEVANVSRYGFDPHERTEALSFIACVAHDNAMDGFTIDYCTNVTFEDCVAYNNGRHGFNIVTSSQNIILNDTISHNNGGSGVVVQTGNYESRGLTSGVTITGGSIYENAGDGIVVRQANNVSIGSSSGGDCVIVTANGRFGILVEGGSNITIERNQVYGNTGGTGSDDAEIRIRGYEQTYLDSDALNDVFVPSNSITFIENIIGVGIQHAYGISYSDTTALILSSGNQINRSLADLVQDISKQGDTPLASASSTDGDDAISGTAGTDSITGDNGNDTINGLNGDDTLYGADGNDTLDGGAGNDTLYGGFGDDIFIVGTGDTVVEYAQGGTDQVRTALASFSLVTFTNVENLSFTGTGNFSGSGNNKANTITGGNGNDTLDGGGNADQLNGGAGNDTYVVDHVSDSLTDASGIDTVRAYLGWTLSDGFENLTLLGTATSGTGNGTANVLTGNGANNTLTGLGGNDTLDGGNGGNDTLDGGLGNDTYVITSTGDTIIDAGGIDTVRVSIAHTLSANIESLVLTGALAINGVGNSGANTLTGNAASNALYGQGGNDTINGGYGRDTLAGGSGYDKFVFNSALSASSNIDAITDFSVVYDTIQLENAIFTKLGAAGTLRSGQFFKGAAAHDADDRIIYNSATGALIYDSNGSAAGGAVQFATVTKGLALTSADFVII